MGRKRNIKKYHKAEPKCWGPLPNFPLSEEENKEMWDKVKTGDYFETNGIKYYIFKQEVTSTNFNSDKPKAEIWIESETLKDGKPIEFINKENEAIK